VVFKFKGKRPLSRPRYKCMDAIKRAGKVWNGFIRLRGREVMSGRML
jgi:hypothetical protein